MTRFSLGNKTARCSITCQPIIIRIVRPPFSHVAVYMCLSGENSFQRVAESHKMDRNAIHFVNVHPLKVLVFNVGSVEGLPCLSESYEERLKAGEASP